MVPPSSADPKTGRNLLAIIRVIAMIAQIVYKITLNERAPAFTTNPVSGFYKCT